MYRYYCILTLIIASNAICLAGEGSATTIELGKSVFTALQSSDTNTITDVYFPSEAQYGQKRSTFEYHRAEQRSTLASTLRRVRAVGISLKDCTLKEVREKDPLAIGTPPEVLNMDVVLICTHEGTDYKILLDNCWKVKSRWYAFQVDWFGPVKKKAQQSTPFRLNVKH